MQISARYQFLMLFLCIFITYASCDIYRNIRSDVSKVFFSPFRVGKRSQFYALHRKLFTQPAIYHDMNLIN